MFIIFFFFSKSSLKMTQILVSKYSIFMSIAIPTLKRQQKICNHSSSSVANCSVYLLVKGNKFYKQFFYICNFIRLKFYLLVKENKFYKQFLFWVPMNIQKDWKSKLESAYSFILTYSKIYSVEQPIPLSNILQPQVYGFLSEII